MKKKLKVIIPTLVVISLLCGMFSVVASADSAVALDESHLDNLNQYFSNKTSFGINNVTFDDAFGWGRGSFSLGNTPTAIRPQSWWTDNITFNRQLADGTYSPTTKTATSGITSMNAGDCTIFTEITASPTSIFRCVFNTESDFVYDDSVNYSNYAIIQIEITDTAVTEEQITQFFRPQVHFSVVNNNGQVTRHSRSLEGYMIYGTDEIGGQRRTYCIPIFENHLLTDGTYQNGIRYITGADGGKYVILGDVSYSIARNGNSGNPWYFEEEVPMRFLKSYWNINNGLPYGKYKFRDVSSFATKSVNNSYNAGFIAGQEAEYGEYSFIESLMRSVSAFFDVPIFGTFSIGDVSLCVLGVAVLIVLLKMFAGG